MLVERQHRCFQVQAVQQSFAARLVLFRFFTSDSRRGLGFDAIGCNRGRAGVLRVILDAGRVDHHRHVSPPRHRDHLPAQLVAAQAFVVILDTNGIRRWQRRCSWPGAVA